MRGDIIAKSADIVSQIDETLEDPRLSREQKERILKDLADAYWLAICPEYGTKAFDSLPESDLADAFGSVPVEGALARCEHPAEILRVLEWPRSGGTFAWLK